MSADKEELDDDQLLAELNELDDEEEELDEEAACQKILDQAK